MNIAATNFNLPILKDNENNSDFYIVHNQNISKKEISEDQIEKSKLKKYKLLFYIHI